MPKVTGIELIKKLQTAGMRLPVIIATAAFAAGGIHATPLAPICPTLFKPFRAAELLSLVRKVLDAGVNTPALTSIK
jgi:DNA-binding NtrC family response regulator